MARASTPTKLSLDEWARIFGIDPLHFNQVVIQDVPSATCDQGWFQYDWQDHERVSREQIADAIRNAEDEIEAVLGYRLMPAYEVDERNAPTRPYRRDHVNASHTDVRGYPLAAPTQWGKFIQGGIERRTLVDDSVVIVWSDADADGYSETGTVGPVALGASGIDACEIGIFYPGKSGAREWEIRPASVMVTGQNATITFRRELAVLEALQEAYPSTEANKPTAVADNDANFLTTVDVYRINNNPATQVSFLWEPLGQCGCGSGDCTLCAYSTQTGCLIARGDPRLGFVGMTPGSYDEDTGAFTTESWAVARAPDLVRLYYRAGLQAGEGCVTKRMDRRWARIVARFAASMLDRNVCDCKNIQEGISRWQRDMAFEDGADQTGTYRIARSELDNPFGTRAGALNAWRAVQASARGKAIIA